MNLFTDPWLSVHVAGRQTFISLSELLCTDEPYQIALPRDDMEMAALQLAVCLTQVAFMPDSEAELRERIARPMSQDEYDQRIKSLAPWFRLDDPNCPFMQTKGVKAAEMTPIQKLLPGLPEGNNHCFFNRPGEIRRLGPPMAAVALFQQATATPSFGGGFKFPLRGAAPVVTLVWDASLRRMVWYNVLHRGAVKQILPWYEAGSEAEIPNWVKPVDKKTHAKDIGLLRGLFWQPARVELVWHEISGDCDLTGWGNGPICLGFLKEKFTYEIEETWPHPHSPRDIARGFISFRSQIPSWTQCHAFVYKEDMQDAGHIPAAVVAQAGTLLRGQPHHRLIGGYCNNKANVIERRHEMLSLGAGWNNQEAGRLRNLVAAALDAKAALTGSLKWIKKGQKDKNLQGIGSSLAPESEKMFYQETEAYIHRCLRTFTFKESKAFREELLERVSEICLQIYDHLTQPYQHQTGMLATIVIGRRQLAYNLHGLSAQAEDPKKPKEVKQRGRK